MASNSIPRKRSEPKTGNPTYVPHHPLENGAKAWLQLRTQAASGISMSGLAGFYCHFLGLSHAWMAEGGIAGWLIPSEFMDVNYGQAVKRYLLSRVTLLHIIALTRTTCSLPTPSYPRPSSGSATRPRPKTTPSPSPSAALF